MYSSHAIWLIVAGLILLLAMIGAITVTVRSPDDSQRKIKPNLGQKPINLNPTSGPEGRRSYSTSKFKAQKVYKNADLEKEKRICDNKDKSGVYMFQNLINYKRYVGSSVNIRRRMYANFNIKYLERKKSMHICRALLLYGYSNFSVEILAYCKPSKCIKKEQDFIDFLKPEYNICKKAGSCLG